MTLIASQITNIQQAFAYIADCNLATVERMSMLNNKSKSEFNRQISIAQKMYNWMNQFEIDYSGTGAEEIDNFDGSVLNWINKSGN